jgi:predicted HTH transcriptional regulator
MKLPSPQIIEGTSFVKCILPGNTPETTLLRQKKDLPTPLQEIYDLFGAAGEVTVAQVMASLNLPRSTAGRHLAALAQAGLIIKKGAGRAARYTARR